MSVSTAHALGPWPTRRLFDLSFFIPGKAHEPYIDPLGDFICVNSKFISTEGQVAKACNKNVTPARKGDILMVMSDLPNGRALAKCFLVDEDDKYAVNQRICILRPKSGNDSQLLFHVLNRNPYFLSFDDGVNQTHLLNATFQKCEVAVPDILPEQQAIAAALSDADGVVAGLERVIAKKRLIKQGAMQDLLTARRRLPGFSGEWEVKPFAQIAKIRNSKVQTLGNPVAQNCIKLEQIEHETGRVLFWVDATSRQTVKYQFQPGDVLFGRLRPYLRKFHRATAQGVCSTEIWPLTTQGVDSGFLYQVVQSDGFITAACEAYGTHMPRADWGKLATHEVQVPVEPREQMAIGQALDDMEREIQTLDSRLAKARAVKEGMMQNLLTGRVRLV